MVYLRAFARKYTKLFCFPRLEGGDQGVGDIICIARMFLCNRPKLRLPGRVKAAKKAGGIIYNHSNNHTKGR